MEKEYHIIFTFRDGENEMDEETLFKYAKRIGDIIEDEECLDLGSVSCKIQSIGENIDGSEDRIDMNNNLVEISQEEFEKKVAAFQELYNSFKKKEYDK